MRVVFFHRKRNQGNFSIENLFEQVRGALPPSIDPVIKNLKYHSVGFLKRFYILLEAAFNQEDVNHITGDIHFIALLLRKRHTVLTIHDLGFMDGRNPLAYFILKWFWIIFPVRRSAIVTVVSEATKIELSKFITDKDISRVRVIYNPLKKGFAPFHKTFDKRDPVILQIGTKYNKNLSRLIKALEGLHCKLEIVGKLNKDIRDELKFRKINYVVSENLTHEAMVDKYRKADIVSFVSTHEGFGLPIVEANAVGRAVITSDLSSMPEIAGNAAHFVNPFDVASIRNGFMEICNNDEYRDKLILNGFENAKRFNLDYIAGQYASVYHSLHHS